MLTVICDTPGTLRAEERPVPTRADGEVLVRVKRVGVCGTDLHIFSGNQPYLNYPRVMGHEFSGIVEQAAPGGRLASGDTVYVMPYMSCGKCVACRQGKTNCCVNIQVLGVHRDGAFTEYLSIPEQFVHKAEGVTLDQAAMVEFLAIGAHAATGQRAGRPARAGGRRRSHRHGSDDFCEAARRPGHSARYPARPARLLRRSAGNECGSRDRVRRRAATRRAYR